jgi:uncharacterized protein YndB with AHSA1/START domain
MKMHSFKISQVIKASRRKVYATWTDPKLAMNFASPPGCTTKSLSVQFKVGGKYKTAMQTPHGLMKNSGEYLEITPNQKIIQTFVWEAPATELNVIVLEFTDHGKDTLLTMTGMGFAVKAEAEGNKGGWKASLKQFSNYFIA